MITWIYESDSFETFCWAEMERNDIMIVRTDNLRWRWRLEVPMKGRRPTGECATLEQAKQNALTAYRYVSEAKVRNAVADDQARVVAFLREQATQWDPDAAGSSALNHAATMIERGLHRRGEGA
jgi:hypothetical protein